MQESEELIKIIDSRIKKYFQMYSISSKIPGEVISISGNSANVKIAGYDTNMNFINKSGESLSPGDSVYIEAIGGNLTNGVIQYKFGE